MIWEDEEEYEPSCPSCQRIKAPHRKPKISPFRGNEAQGLLQVCFQIMWIAIGNSLIPSASLHKWVLARFVPIHTIPRWIDRSNVLIRALRITLEFCNNLTKHSVMNFSPFWLAKGKEFATLLVIIAKSNDTKSEDVDEILKAWQET